MNKFLAFAAPIFAILGFKWEENKDKKELTAEETEKLKLFGFSETFLTAFGEALKAGFPEETPGKKKNDPTPENAQQAVVSGLLADITAKYSAALLEMEDLKKEKGDLSAEVEAKKTEITGLEGKIKILSDKAEEDPGAGAQHGQIKPDAKHMKLDWHDEKQVGGIEGVMFAMDRAYNQRLRGEMLLKEGIQVGVPVASSVDFKKLQDDLGAFYETRWQDRLQSLLMKLPTLESIFPLESGFQDLATLTNIWLGEFSQSDNTSSDFDKVTKGQYDFGNETLRMFSVMFAHKFTDLKQLEKSWIGYYNKEGSQVIKWSFIEYILAETAVKLHNEREQRRINGVRKEPDYNKPGQAMHAADGLYEFINKKVNGFIDIHSGKTVYQIKPFKIGEITESNIGEKIYRATAMIPATLRDSGSLRLYMPSHMVVWYHKYNEVRYGGNQDYKADIMYVKEYPKVRLIPVPNADNHHRLIWTFDQNIKLFEHVPGEMTRFNIEQQDWTLKVWSNWKESTWAIAVGYKYERKQDMDGSRQMIFCNEYDWPTTYFVPTNKDEQPSAKLHSSIETVANTAVLEITDILDAETGKTIYLKCGSTDKGVKINKAGNFAMIKENWTPKQGDIIKLIKRADGKFIELGRITGASDALQFEANETTPSLLGAETFVTGDNTQATAITKFEDAAIDQVYTIYGNGDTNASTIANSGNFVLTEAMTLSTGKFIRLIKAEDGKFYEVERG